MFRRTIAAAAMFAAGFLGAADAGADNLRWEIRSTYPYRIYLEFYSQDYERSWPGGGEVYIFDDSRFHVFNLSCSPGELICYGGWVTTDENTYWGVGPYNSHSCSDCCVRCGGRSNRITLSR